MNAVIFDTESDGFVYEATQIWCIVTIEESTKNLQKFFGKNVEDGIRYLQEADVLVGHNILKHDIPLIKKLYPWFKPKGTQIDTLVLSCLLNPDRFGGHSIEAWGERFNRHKPDHEDWSRFTPEMLHRCEEDTWINRSVFRHLLKEAKEPITGVKAYG